nr:hypothetical protein [Opitutae bacterium KCR 482]
SHRIPYDALNPLSLSQTCTHNIKAFTSGLTHRCNHRLPQIELDVVKNYTAEHRPLSRSKPYSKIPRGSKKHFASAFVNLLAAKLTVFFKNRKILPTRILFKNTTLFPPKACHLTLSFM